MEEKSLRETTMKSDLSDCGITEDLRKMLVQVLRNALIHDRNKAEAELKRKVKELRDAWIHDRVKYALEGKAEAEAELKRKVKELRDAWIHDRVKKALEGKAELLRNALYYDRNKQDMTSNLSEAEVGLFWKVKELRDDRVKKALEGKAELLRNAKEKRDAWIHDRDKQKQYMTFYEAAAEEEDEKSNGMYAEMLRNWNPDPAMMSNHYEEHYEEDSSEEYDYDYTDCGQEYQDMLKHRVASFLHEELPTDKKRNPTLMGKQLLTKAIEEGEDGIWDGFQKRQAVKEAGDALDKHLVDFPRAIMYMATISHSLSCPNSNLVTTV